ncbi:MAG: hypothetical protein IPK05_19730 [Comamonadaceae bacterium]|nr:hypothetical protein [Comamonadaceae bacterium]
MLSAQRRVQLEQRSVDLFERSAQAAAASRSGRGHAARRKRGAGRGRTGA